MNKEKLVEKLINFKLWLFSLGIGGLAICLWWIIKIIICLTMGICLI